MPHKLRARRFWISSIFSVMNRRKVSFNPSENLRLGSFMESSVRPKDEFESKCS